MFGGTLCIMPCQSIQQFCSYMAYILIALTTPRTLITKARFAHKMCVRDWARRGRTMCVRCVSEWLVRRIRGFVCVPYHGVQCSHGLNGSAIKDMLNNSRRKFPKMRGARTLLLLFRQLSLSLSTLCAQHTGCVVLAEVMKNARA